MLDHLQMALRRYKRIAPDPGKDMSMSQAEQIADWLKRDVSRVTSALLDRPGFRRRVRWPIERLTGEIECEERETLLAVDALLVQYAKAIAALARSDDIYSELLRQVPRRTENEADRGSLDGSNEEELPGLLAVDFVASRPWLDLSSSRDYFYPTSQLNLVESDGMQWAHFLPYSNRLLKAPGDFVTRCTDIRIEHWLDTLHRFFIRCDTAQKTADVDLGPSSAELDSIRVELYKQINKLRSLPFGAEAGIRDSCISLLQIHAGFHQDTDLSWLGPTAAMVSGVAGYPHQVSRQFQWDIPEKAAAALIDIADIVRRQPPEEIIEEMKANRRLVLIEEQRQGFFDGRPIEANEPIAIWHGRHELMWELLWTLADRTLIRRSVDCYCLTNRKAQEANEPPSTQAVKDRRSGLKKLIVSELNDLIVDAGRGTYRLNLEPDDVCLLGWFNEDTLNVLPPSAPRQSHS